MIINGKKSLKKNSIIMRKLKVMNTTKYSRYSAGEELFESTY